MTAEVLTKIKCENIVAQSVRKSHCARSGHEHECVGVCTISPKGIDLACVLCGSDAASFRWLNEDVRNVRSIFTAVGIEFDVLSGEGQARALDAYREIAAELRRKP